MDKDRARHSSHRDRDHDRVRRDSTGSALRHHDESSIDRPREKRIRAVSKSPPRFSDKKPRSEPNDRPKRDLPRGSAKDKARDGTREERYSREQSVSERGSTPIATVSSRSETEQKPHQTQKGVSFKLSKKLNADKYVPLCKRLQITDTLLASSVDIQSTADAAPSSSALDTAPLSEAELIEQRRKRREAIKARHKGQTSEPSSLLVQVLDPSKAIHSAEGQADAPNSPSQGVGGLLPRSYLVCADHRTESLTISPPVTPRERSGTDSPSNFDIPRESDVANSHAQTNGEFDDEPSAADYDPTADMQEDQRRHNERQYGEEVTAEMYDETKNNNQDVLVPKTAESETSKKKKAEFDMFADEDDDDMFAEAPATKDPGEHAASRAIPVPRAAIDMSMLDDFDDEDGYYKIIIGELLENRYHVQMNLGKGMFSAVVRAMDQVTHRLVAIKIIRNNETM